MMINCEKAAIICNKTQYKDASFVDKMKLRFHLFMCKTCSKFTKKNTELTSICEKANLHSLSEKEKNHMKHELQSNS